MKIFALLLLIGVSAVYSAPQSAIEFAIFEVINSAIPNVVVNIPQPTATRPVVNVPIVTNPQGGTTAFASARGPPGSRIVTRTSVSRDEDDRRK